MAPFPRYHDIISNIASQAKYIHGDSKKHEQTLYWHSFCTLHRNFLGRGKSFRACSCPSRCGYGNSYSAASLSRYHLLWHLPGMVRPRLPEKDSTGTGASFYLRYSLCSVHLYGISLLFKISHSFCRPYYSLHLPSRHPHRWNFYYAGTPHLRPDCVGFSYSSRCMGGHVFRKRRSSKHCPSRNSLGACSRYGASRSISLGAKNSERRTHYPRQPYFLFPSLGWTLHGSCKASLCWMARYCTPFPQRLGIYLPSHRYRKLVGVRSVLHSP